MLMLGYLYSMKTLLPSPIANEDKAELGAAPLSSKQTNTELLPSLIVSTPLDLVPLSSTYTGDGANETPMGGGRQDAPLLHASNVAECEMSRSCLPSVQVSP